MEQLPKLDWDQLVHVSKPTFQGVQVPYGFSTRVTALVREQQQKRQMEWMGWKAFQMAFCTVILLAALRISLISNSTTEDDLEPGTQSLLHVNDPSLSML